MPGVAFTTLAHHIDIEWLYEAYRRTRKDGAVGVDGQTAEGDAANLEGNYKYASGRRTLAIPNPSASMDCTRSTRRTQRCVPRPMLRCGSLRWSRAASDLSKRQRVRERRVG